MSLENRTSLLKVIVGVLKTHCREDTIKNIFIYVIIVINYIRTTHMTVRKSLPEGKDLDLFVHWHNS